ncbi:DUF1003 domain-containing protein [Mucilaginibacter rubeus]|uniref:DUF1003 domain-containing protein n=2 Tax=Mucilaginibacter rubeus TaxID=2027860 RepID=A0A5C1HXW6_9SPHI|nr:DUF1003 domain-containing protein [Mucilaginibacter rubeus]
MILVWGMNLTIERMKGKSVSRSVPDPKGGPDDRAAILLSDILGSVWLLIAFLALIGFYLLWNFGLIKGLQPFDEAPFNVLDTILSIFAIVLSVAVLISQKRQRRLEKIREQVEFEVNVRAEHEITKILEMLHTIQQKLGITNNDQELEEMKKKTDIADIHEKIRKNS